MTSINPDAHSTREIDLTHWGVEMARKGGVPADRVLNCFPLPSFSSYLESRRRSRCQKGDGALAEVEGRAVRTDLVEEIAGCVVANGNPRSRVANARRAKPEIPLRSTR